MTKKELQLFHSLTIKLSIYLFGHTQHFQKSELQIYRCGLFLYSCIEIQKVKIKRIN